MKIKLHCAEHYKGVKAMVFVFSHLIIKYLHGRNLK